MNNYYESKLDTLIKGGHNLDYLEFVKMMINEVSGFGTLTAKQLLEFVIKAEKDYDIYLKAWEQDEQRALENKWRILKSRIKTGGDRRLFKVTVPTYDPDDYIVCGINQEPDNEMIASVWAFLEVFKLNTKIKYSDVRRASYPAKVAITSRLVDSCTTHSFAYVTSSTLDTCLNLSKQIKKTYRAQEKQKITTITNTTYKTIQYFVVSNASVVEAIKQLNLGIDYIILYYKAEKSPYAKPNEYTMIQVPAEENI